MTDPRLPEFSTLLLRHEAGVLYVTMNRPERKNALSATMMDELLEAFSKVAEVFQPRAIVLRGAGGTFCAGADIKDMPKSRVSDGSDPKRAVAQGNRRFGEVLCAALNVPAPLIAVVEGAALGGGFGLVCVSDIAFGLPSARFGLPETGLGVIPAQIAPFVLRRVGPVQAPRLMLTGARFGAEEAQRLGILHEVCADESALETSLTRTLADIRRCGPQANAATKRLLRSVETNDLNTALDIAADVFAEAQLGPEAKEGTQAFLEKRLPAWAK
ncbi:MAG TPA: enoyl-CoA hydratase-related protein [Polyangiales bacterium]|nr:enoyl-CoA hydratase-related protein [Polyangiales bacterium]